MNATDEELGWTQDSDWVDFEDAAVSIANGFRVSITPDQFGSTYVGPVYMGAQAQKLNVVFDTGSDWLVLEGQKCTDC